MRPVLKSIAFPATMLLLASTALSAEGSFISDGVTIHTIEEGTGETVILLHGFAGTSQMWSNLGLMPIDGFRAIAFDARGHGKSDKPSDADAYGDSMVQDLLALLDAHQVQQAHLVGYSMGAETALNFAVHYPDRVKTLTVAGSGWSGEPEVQTYKFVAEALANSETFGGFMQAMTPPDLELTPEEQMAGFRLLQAHGISPDQAAEPLSLVAANLTDIISLSDDQIKNLDMPVLGLAGSEDGEAPNVQRLGEALDNFEYVKIQGADHLMAPLDPIFAQQIIAFLNQ